MTTTLLPPAPAAEVSSVLGKVRHILEAFRPDEETVALAELVRRTGMPKATVHRLCQELVDWGALERAGPGYRLGLRLFELGQLAPRQRVLREVALPYLEELARATQETVHCAVRDGDEVLYVEKLGGHRRVSRPSRTGGRMPLTCTATGKVLLAFAPVAVTERVVSRPLPRLTRYTNVSPRRLRAELEQVRAAGYAVECEQTRIGYLSVAAPVFGTGGVVAGAVSVAAPTSRTQVRRLVPAVRATAAAVTRGLCAGEHARGGGVTVARGLPQRRPQPFR